MRLVGLISGGKDSLFNMLQCIAAGHEIVAVANIEPYIDGELDSYMFQSVGHEAITLVANALCLPIFREKTSGKAVCLDKTYITTSKDEVEDLWSLLQKVKKEVNIDGVSVGAIASDYQRTRVENVCSRLGLKCFAYLWRRNQMELLQEMIDADLNAIIIKVACIGFAPNHHLGMSLREIQPYLLDLHKKYGMNVCGEGGEYETLTLDCPLFHRSISIISSEKVILSDDAFAPVGFLSVKNATLEPKSPMEISGSSTILQDKIRIIQSLIKNPESYIDDCVDEISAAIFPQKVARNLVPDLPFPFETMESSESAHSAPLKEYWKNSSSLRQQLSCTISPSNSRHLFDSSICNLSYTSGWCCIGNVTGSNLSEALNTLQTHLQRMNYDFRDVVFIDVFVKDLSAFKALNAVYSQFVPEFQPPARACVETIMPPEVEVMLFTVAHKKVSKSQKAINSVATEEKEVMHVQSISHWAPASIGTYSQCIKVREIYFVAGQIPLIPGSMVILNKPIVQQCKLALRHILRILQAMNESLSYSNIFQAVCYVTSEEIAADMYSLWTYITGVHHASVCIVVVTGLPRKAQLEWKVIGCSSKNPSVDERIETLEDFNIYIKRCVYSKPFTSSIVCKVSYVVKSNKTSSRNIVTFLTGNGIVHVLQQCVKFLKNDFEIKNSLLCSLKFFYKASKSAIPNILPDVLEFAKDSKVTVTTIPVVACENRDVFLTVTGICC